MPGRGPQTFKKRQKEQQRKERQQDKVAKRLERKDQPSETERGSGPPIAEESSIQAMQAILDADPR